ncbi:argonaute 3 isoform X2 [Anticarsia gemmatalis]
MDDPGKGRGRGLALLQALKKNQEAASSASSSPDPQQSPMSSASPSASPSMVSTATSLAGRGRVAAMLLAKVQKPGGPPIISPASDVGPSLPKGVGRGLKLLQSLQASKVASEVGKPDIQQISDKMAVTSISQSPSTVTSTTQSVTKSKKHFREIKETPPVVKMGSYGTPIPVTSNYIFLKFEENSVYEYEVRFVPDQDYLHLRFKLLAEHSQYFKEKTFDGTTLYVPRKLPDEALNLISTNPFDNSKVAITILFRRTRRLSEMIHIYNVIFKCIMKDLQLVRFNREHFNPNAAIQIPQHKLEVWPGYVTAVDEYEGGLMLTLDSTHRVLRTQSVLSFIKDTVQAEGANWKRILSERLVGCSVMTSYNKKLFRIDSIDDNMTPKSTFEKLDKGVPVKISFIEYYKKNYGIQIKDWDQPLLISRSTKRQAGTETMTDFMICLVPELCQLTGLTDDQRSNFKLMKDVATYTKITPNQRHLAFKKYIQAVMSNESAKNRLKGWGLSIAPDTVELTARTLPPEPLYFGNNVKVNGKANAEWNNEATRNCVMQAVDITKWVLFHTDRDRQVATDFQETLKRCCNPMGIMVSRPDVIRLPNDRTDTYVTFLKKSITSDLQLVVIICPSSRDDRYGAIKKICCSDHPVASQVINARTLMKHDKLRSVTQKILLQMNCKLGGTLWNINIPCKNVMVVGIDAHHDASRKRQSVCGFVASYNQTMTHWFSRAVLQDRGQEISEKLKNCFVEAVEHYFQCNAMLPEKIIIYRDGVGDGQFATIRDYELPQIQMSLQVLGSSYHPKITYIVVQKRINTRIFMKTNSGLENPHAGTVLDNTITRRDWYDFLIASQRVTQGTVTPTHYVVVYDDSGMPPDHCQRLTYKLCHLYYNWPGTVRVPAPCQYAHKLAYLVGQSMHQLPSTSLCDKLFFL